MVFGGDYVDSFDCFYCNKHTQAIQIRMESDEGLFYQIVECSNEKCNRKMLFVHKQTRNPGRVSVVVILKLIHQYPNADEKVDASIPEDIRESYVQGIRCLNADAPLGAVTCFRRALQQICKDKGATATGLKNQIDEIIPAPYKELTTEIREWGNLGAHPDDVILEVTKEDAVEIRDFIKSVFEIIYIVPEKVKERKNKRTSGTT